MIKGHSAKNGTNATDAKLGNQPPKIPKYKQYNHLIYNYIY